jgi:arylsulfatase A-like enzyme
VNFRGVGRHLARGLLQGLVAWSAYAVTEFVFSSVVYALARPYAVFPAWHWQLTGILIAGFLGAGFVAGAVAGLAVFIMRGTGLFQSIPSTAIESAATLSVVLAFVIHVLVKPRGNAGWYWVLSAGIIFAALLALATGSRIWANRFGLLTNPWVVFGLLLGFGQVWVIVNMDVAEQLGRHVDRWADLLSLLLVLLVLGSVWVGKWKNGQGFRIGIQAARIAAPVLVLILLAVSEVLAAAQVTHPAFPVPDIPKRPNVLLIVLDTVRADHLSVYGYDRRTTPNLETLARDSMVYKNALSASDITITSHASLFTGDYPSWNGAYCQPPEAAYGRPLSAGVPTLAEILSRQGYATTGAAANLYLRSDFGLERGFRSFRIPRPVPILPVENWYFLRYPVGRVMGYVSDQSQFDRLYARSEDVNRELFAELEESKSSAPSFIFLNYMDAHFPYVPPAPFDHLFPGRRRGITAEDLNGEQEQISGGRPLPPDYQPHTISQYDGGIAYMDAQVGTLLQRLKESGLYDDTMIIVTADHGEAFGNHHRVGHANSPYQDLLHVPLLIKFPSSSKKGTTDEPVSLIDVAPTVLDVLGIPVPASMQGRSLLSAAALEHRELFAETFPCPALEPPECPRGCQARAVFSWPYKYITFSNGRRELFDVHSDPEEQRDLSASLSPVLQQMRLDLLAWTKTLPVRAREKGPLGSDTIQNLKSLGYVGQ